MLFGAEAASKQPFVWQAGDGKIFKLILRKDFGYGRGGALLGSCSKMPFGISCNYSLIIVNTAVCAADFHSVIYFNIVLPSMQVSPLWSLPIRFSD
jgi:hypothetical protein